MVHEGTQIERARWQVGKMVSRLQPGGRLPSYQKMKELLGVNQHALDVVYDELARDGVIERRDRSGIYVTSPFQEACFIYVASADEMLSETEGAPKRQNLRELNRLAGEFFPGSLIQVLLLPPGRDCPDDTILSHIDVLRRNQRILGIFASGLTVSLALQTALTEWELPCVGANSAANPLSVMIRQSDAWWAAPLQHLREEGQEHVVLIRWTGGREAHSEAPGTTPGFESIERVALSGTGTRHPEDEGALYIQKLLAEKTLPDAFLIEDDYVCRGMLRGALNKGIHLEDHCALITLINEGAPIPATRELTRLELRWSEIAKVQVRLMAGAVRGDPPPHDPITIRPVFVIGKTSRRIDYPRR